jgi:hypothetical protein
MPLTTLTCFNDIFNVAFVRNYSADKEQNESDENAMIHFRTHLLIGVSGSTSICAELPLISTYKSLRTQLVILK